MKWQIPAKTFLLGEYAAVSHQSAVLLTTTPYFELTLRPEPGLIGIHAQSPAGLWWNKHHFSQGLAWRDPYEGLGGLGASSAQFLGAYQASCALQDEEFNQDALLEAYELCAFSGLGLKPSGYDVLAQSQADCVFINRKHQVLESSPWPFEDLAFILMHTGHKLATHLHLQETKLPEEISYLSELADQGWLALQQKQSARLVECVNAYHNALKSTGHVAPNTLRLIDALSDVPEILAIKGCGAMGSDVLLALCSAQEKTNLIKKLSCAHHLLPNVRIL
jgi:mevalonate kinase